MIKGPRDIALTANVLPPSSIGTTPKGKKFVPGSKLFLLKANYFFFERI